MSLSLMIYLVGLVDSLSIGLIFLGCFVLVVAFGVVKGLIDNDEVVSSTWLKFKIAIGAAVLMFLIAMFLPSSSTLAAMYLVPRIVENKDIQQMPANAAKLLNLGLEKFIDDLTDSKKSKKPELG